ncbi:MAG: tetraacyldisaccharide 4'-kinase, partial [Gemmatimonadales bacterium]
MRLIEKIWAGESFTDRIARAALVPFEALYRGGVALRGELYDRGVFAAEHAAIPVVSVGNLTVGGTGKTPVSAWIADQLGRRGFTPAIVLRGYGLDEPMVHRRLNPGINIIVASDRVAAAKQALETGSDIVVLDDAFQHRRAARDLDIVLVSADAWSENQHLLPAGPYREPLSSLKRASAIVITRKAANDERVADAARAVREHASGTPVAVVRLSLSEIVRESDSD